MNSENTVEFPFGTKRLFDECVKNQVIPKNDFKKQAILLRLLDDFLDERKYTEQEVNDIIKKHFQDYTLLRRELINFNYMGRNPHIGEYWVIKRKLTIQDILSNTLLKRHAKAFINLE